VVAGVMGVPYAAVVPGLVPAADPTALNSFDPRGTNNIRLPPPN